MTERDDHDRVERAAIHEVLGGLDRAEAERLAADVDPLSFSEVLRTDRGPALPWALNHPIQWWELPA